MADLNLNPVPPSVPFVLVEIQSRVFLLNQQTGDLWEIDRDKFQYWACARTVGANVGVVAGAAPLKSQVIGASQEPGGDRYELVGTDLVEIEGVAYHGQFQPRSNDQPQGEGELRIARRDSPRDYVLILASQHESRQDAWAAFDQWVTAERELKAAQGDGNDEKEA